MKVTNILITLTLIDTADKTYLILTIIMTIKYKLPTSLAGGKLS